VGRFDPRLMVTLGMLWMASMMAWRSTFALNIDFGRLVIPNLLQGFALPFFFIPLMTIGTGSLPPAETANGAALISFVRTTAGAFGTSIVTTNWDNAATRARVGLLNQPGDGARTAMDALQGAGLSFDESLRQYEALLQSQSVMVATDHIFLIISLVLTAAAASVWIAPRPQRRTGSMGVH
jgi:DHA2 family multidrug resistance protein